MHKSDYDEEKNQKNIFNFTMLDILYRSVAFFPLLYLTENATNNHGEYWVCKMRWHKTLPGWLLFGFHSFLNLSERKKEMEEELKGKKMEKEKLAEQRR